MPLDHPAECTCIYVHEAETHNRIRVVVADCPAHGVNRPYAHPADCRYCLAGQSVHDHIYLARKHDECDPSRNMHFYPVLEDGYTTDPVCQCGKTDRRELRKRAEAHWTAPQDDDVEVGYGSGGRGIVLVGCASLALGILIGMLVVLFG